MSHRPLIPGPARMGTSAAPSLPVPIRNRATTRTVGTRFTGSPAMVPGTIALIVAASIPSIERSGGLVEVSTEATKGL